MVYVVLLAPVGYLDGAYAASELLVRNCGNKAAAIPACRMAAGHRRKP
jgi:hypothetical protein